MASNKTLYVNDKDEEIWDKAKEYAGESLSQLVTSQLRSFVTTKEAEAKGFKERIILRFNNDENLATAKAFYGRWLIGPDKPFTLPSSSPDNFLVGVTAKENVFVFKYYVHFENEKYGYGKLMVYPSFQQAGRDNNLPYGLIANAMESMGVEIEELDI